MCKRLSSSPARLYSLWDPHSFLFEWVPCSVPGVRRRGRQVDHSPASSVDVKNEWSDTVTPPIRLHDLFTATCTFAFRRPPTMQLLSVGTSDGTATDWLIYLLSDWLTLLTYLLTPCSRVLQKLTGPQLVKKFPAFYATLSFITAFTNARHLYLSWASPILSIPS